MRALCRTRLGRKGWCPQAAEDISATATGFIFRCSAGHTFNVSKQEVEWSPDLQAIGRDVKPAYNPRNESEGDTLKREGMVRVDAAAEKEWKIAADTAVHEAASELREFTSDHVWMRIPETLRASREPRAMGPVMKRAAVAGVIKNTGRVKNSEMAACHSRPKAIWKSLVGVFA